MKQAEDTPRGDASDSPSTELEELVANCIVAIANGDLDAVERLLRSKPQLELEARAHLDDLSRTGLIEDHPREVGPYRILEPLGRGGMGTVYLAEQREPVRRKVALKLVRRGMDTHEVLARFAIERQALALMNHASISKVFDAGSTHDGRPYFVMEHVPGLPITDYCDRRSFDPGQRIALLLQVCDGVQHAHQKGIVHRDLKPSNLLVMEQDGAPVPKIIDFGIAKATDQRIGGATIHTMQGVVLGTPEYMSPEQAGRDALDVDLRTDIYSLGVVLYELLSGDLPFPSERLRGDPDSLQRILREEDPLSPSKRLSTRRDATPSRAKLRSTTANDLVRRLRGDLDWICLKALEKDRERRYATVNEFAADLRRHLAHEPVLAGPPSRSYQLAKFVRRNRLQVVAACAVLIALIAGLVVSLVYKSRAEDAAAVATHALEAESKALASEQSARADAERDFASALEAVDVLLTRVAEAHLDSVPRTTKIRRQILDDAAGFYRRFLENRSDDPRARFHAAAARVALVRITSSLGDKTGAIELARTALAELDALLAQDPADHRSRFERANAYDGLGQSLDEMGDSLGARKAFAAALDDLHILANETPSNRKILRHLTAQLHNAALNERRRDPERSLAMWQESAEVLDRLRAGGEDAIWVARMTVVEQSCIAGRMLLVRDAAGAQAALDLAQHSLAQFDLENTFDADLKEAAVEVHRFSGILHHRAGRRAEAVAAARAQIAVAEALVRDNPELPAYRGIRATAFGDLAVFLSSTGVDDEARDAFRMVVKAYAELVEQVPGDMQTKRMFATHSGNLAHALHLDGKRASLGEARVHAENAVRIARQEVDPGQGPSRLIHALTILVDIDTADGRADDAIGLAKDAVAVAASWQERTSSRESDLAIIQASQSLASIALDKGDFVTATDVLRRSRTFADTIPDRARADRDLGGELADLAHLEGRLAIETGDHARALEIVRRLPSLYPPDDKSGPTAIAELLAGVALLRSDNELVEEATDTLRRVIETLRAKAPDDQPTIERRNRAKLEVLLCALMHRRGEKDAARKVLDPAIKVLEASRGVLHDDAVATERLEMARRLD